jgi:hypothetical protein
MADDAMVPIARILGRGEALTVASMLDAAGIIVHVGGEHHMNANPTIIAIGGFRLTVPASQHHEASLLLGDLLARLDDSTPAHMRRAIKRLVVAIMTASGVVALPYTLLYGAHALFTIIVSPLLILQTPVNPVGRGDYYLSAQPR